MELNRLRRLNLQRTIAMLKELHLFQQMDIGNEVIFDELITVIKEEIKEIELGNVPDEKDKK